MTDEMLTQLGMQLGIPALILFLMFIIWDLAKEAKAGKTGMIALFVALGVGMMGYVIKVILQWQLEH
ncbi:DUF2788 domain-containing protein [Agitococcus lubricus]|uniref:Uncharacterized protein DUF2788 n=1 Tax=Agitococcus lubricus TaxID=1077255 RepID=A0A2T5IZN3_9GAMM|nr:DUF2788 domain-containing protein [Agitococcus lubricus]PTQ89540.1 uncharacterized protein DUF2788 [Agitococcus lubricus]